ncbi:MAG: NAD-dependent dehydratase [Myxococcaceae bacterium]|nr:NAD-dependent dehydratase [Myxococcaceae bacterium]
MNALVTGANGHIGSHVVRACLEAGMKPVAFVRPGSDRRALAGLDVELREGDLLDAPSVEKAMAGAEVVFHVGAVHRNWAPDEAAILGPAVSGTRNVLDAARRAGVRRVVCTSSGATVGFTPDPSKPLDESAPLPTPRSVYSRAKLEAEKLALTADGVDVVVVNPSGVFGPRDYRLTPATRAIVGLLQGDPAFLGVCLTDVRDVAKGHLLAASAGKKSHRYLLTGDVLTPAQVAAAFHEVTGVRPSTFSPPRFLLNFLAGSAEKKARKSGQDAAVTRDQIHDVFGHHLAYDSRRAKTDLAATFRPAKDVLRDAVRWLLYFDGLKPKVAAKVRAALGAAAAPDPDWSR